MFRRLEEKAEERVTITIDGQLCEAAVGETVAAAVLANGIRDTRTTPVSGALRAPFCLMGVCYECLMVIDGQSNQRACRERVHEGMIVERQKGPGTLPS